MNAPNDKRLYALESFATRTSDIASEALKPPFRVPIQSHADGLCRRRIRTQGLMTPETSVSAILGRLQLLLTGHSVTADGEDIAMNQPANFIATYEKEQRNSFYFAVSLHPSIGVLFGTRL